jgi:UDP-glucose 4-epimerase
VDQALRGDPITVFGNGRQTRCFADVSDVVRALLLLMEKPAAVGQVFNVGNPEEISIGDLAKLVKRLTRSESEIRLIPYDEAYEPGFEDMERRVPSIDKISQCVGFAPRIKLREIVRRIVDSKHQELAEAAPPVTAALRSPALRVGAGE